MCLRHQKSNVFPQLLHLPEYTETDPCSPPESYVAYLPLVNHWWAYCAVSDWGPQPLALTSSAWDFPSLVLPPGRTSRPPESPSYAGRSRILGERVPKALAMIIIFKNIVEK
ncbi:hypothetical protein I7I51_02835 [Histoplasma capsulatum]|uniref:Uncharacterized protein n=1 Tax=Ajellomyces capsulatus TaxID=5037 RepID=A0A8A1MJJ4_AJECA|nr:hypothetical protein I7I51_02835 [Histoplasma capsulatum]